MPEIISLIANELKLPITKVTATLELLNSGNTIPFIARYRKEVTGSLDEEQIRLISERSTYLNGVVERRSEVLRSIAEQGKLTPELEETLNKTWVKQEIEDLYLPYKQKKTTRATVARKRGLAPLADLILAQTNVTEDLENIAKPYIDSEKGVADSSAAWQGAMDIVAETISDRADVRDALRREIMRTGQLTSTLAVSEEEGAAYLMYKEYSESVRLIPPHRILALNRGENVGALKVKLVLPEETILSRLTCLLEIKPNGSFTAHYNAALADAYKRLIFPALERETRSALTEKAEAQAIAVFGKNLRQLLLTQPISGHTILGLDPGYRTGCKAAVISPQGDVLATSTLYFTRSDREAAQAKAEFLRLVRTYKVTLVSIGNGTASYETETFTAELIAEHNLPLAYVITSEAGASVYSASPLARAELPNLDVSLRGAVSIARRVQDPLAELVKIEPKAIGVGQYQHDVNQKTLANTLGDTVESCVNYVGVELNTASPALLGYVAGISAGVAKNIVAYRAEHGSFNSRQELLKVPRLGPATFTQCAGFLRIKAATNPLDNTPVHPESYPLAAQIIHYLGFTPADCGSQTALTLAAAKADANKIAHELKAGLPTVTDILAALTKPGRDAREDSPAPLSRKAITKLSDLTIGSVVKGRVENVVDFGAFVDIGLKISGLIHRSQLSNRPFRHPLDIVSVGDIVDATIISIDEKRNRIGLSLKEGKGK